MTQLNMMSRLGTFQRLCLSTKAHYFLLAYTLCMHGTVYRYIHTETSGLLAALFVDMCMYICIALSSSDEKGLCYCPTRGLPGLILQSSGLELQG